MIFNILKLQRASAPDISWLPLFENDYIQLITIQRDSGPPIRNNIKETRTSTPASNETD